jgi:diketogulonate reductase-like aldo/keto reductase
MNDHDHHHELEREDYGEEKISTNTDSLDWNLSEEELDLLHEWYTDERFI